MCVPVPATRRDPRNRLVAPPGIMRCGSARRRQVGAGASHEVGMSGAGEASEGDPGEGPPGCSNPSPTVGAMEVEQIPGSGN